MAVARASKPSGTCRLAAPGEIVASLAKICAALWLCALVMAPSSSPAADDGCCVSSAPIRVALFSDAASTDERSREGAWRVLTAEPTFRVERATTATLAAGQLSQTDVLIIPGGTASGIGRALGIEGGTSVTEFVKAGGGLVGICAGGYLIVEGWSPATKAIEVVNAESWDDEHWARGEGFISVALAGGEANDPTTSRSMWFENGPIFVPGKLSQPAYTPLVKYVTDLAAADAPKGMMTGRDAVVASPFGNGRVVAFGPHPELSPGLNHWLVNAVAWSSGRRGEGETTITLQAVLGEEIVKKP